MIKEGTLQQYLAEKVLLKDEYINADNETKIKLLIHFIKNQDSWFIKKPRKFSGHRMMEYSETEDQSSEPK